MRAKCDSKRSEAKRLWSTCFEDPRPFVEMYFDRIYRDEETLLGYDPESGQAISHVGLPTYSLALSGETLPVGYISGACTLPEYRGQGEMQHLMRRALRLMHERGDVASFLIPASESLYTYYRKGFGYGTAFFFELSHNLDESDTIGVRGSELIDFLILCEAESKGHSIRHSRAQWEAVLADYSLAEVSHTLIERDREGSITGVAFYLMSDEALELRALYGFAYHREELLQELRRRAEGRSLRLIRPVRSHTPTLWQPKGMLRPLRLLPLLEHWTGSKGQTELHAYIEDDLIAANTGSYLITPSGIRYSPTREPEAKPMSLSTLVERLAHEHPLSMELMME